MTLVGIILKLEFQRGMDSSLVYHDNVIFVAEVRCMCVVLCNKIVIKF